VSVEKENTMNRIKLNGAVLVALLGLLAWPGASFAQVTKDQLEAAGAKLQAPRVFFNKLPDQQRRMLSGSAQLLPCGSGMAQFAEAGAPRPNVSAFQFAYRFVVL